MNKEKNSLINIYNKVVEIVNNNNQNPNSERKVIKIDRIERKAISAMKQSIKATLPLIDEMVSLKLFLAHLLQVFLFHL